jgi:hypothetical protein
MARIKDAQARRKRDHGAIQTTSIELTFELTADEARLLPPSARIKPNFPGVAFVDSTVLHTGGVIILRYYLSDRPYDGIPLEKVPLLALATLNAWLEKLKTEAASRNTEKKR